MCYFTDLFLSAIPPLPSPPPRIFPRKYASVDRAFGEPPLYCCTNSFKKVLESHLVQAVANITKSYDVSDCPLHWMVFCWSEKGKPCTRRADHRFPHHDLDLPGKTGPIPNLVRSSSCRRMRPTHGSVQRHMCPGLDMYNADPAQSLTTAG